MCGRPWADGNDVIQIDENSLFGPIKIFVGHGGGPFIGWWFVYIII
jgi:hypothetical protein